MEPPLLNQLAAHPPPSKTLCGRYAPSPTGDIHLGNARTALVAWLSARSRGGNFIWRVEDLDGPRVVPGIEQHQLDDLAWLGLDWDAGPNIDDQSLLAPFHQSQRNRFYEDALRVLDSLGLVFPCPLSRKDLREIASAPHGAESSPYASVLRPKEVTTGWLKALLADPNPEASVRFKVNSQTISFEDILYGPIAENVSESVGDFILRRRDGLWAYQLAVVVDDAQQGITEIVRGADLLSSTARQILLQQSLGLPTPRYLHVPLMVGENGEKLSKRNNAPTLRGLRKAGWTTERTVGYLAWTLNLLAKPTEATAGSLLPLFDPEKIPRDEVVVSQEVLSAGKSETRHNPC